MLKGKFMEEQFIRVLRDGGRRAICAGSTGLAMQK